MLRRISSEQRAVCRSEFRTVGARRAYNASHAHLGCTFDQAVCHQAIRIGYAAQRTSDGQNAIVHAGDDLTDARPDAGLVSEVCDILAGLANDDASLLGSDNGTEGELCLGVLLFCALVVVSAEVAYLIGEMVNARVDGRRGVFGGHGEQSGRRVGVGRKNLGVEAVRCGRAQASKVW